MGTITKIDIGSACLVSFNKSARTRTHKRVASFVVTRQVRFGFDNDAGATTPIQSGPDKVTRRDHRLPFEKGSTDDLTLRIVIGSISQRKAWCLQGQRYYQSGCNWQPLPFDLANNFMPLEVIDQRVARLDRMQLAIYGGTFQQGTQLHKSMTGAARVERVQCDDVSFATLE